MRICALSVVHTAQSEAKTSIDFGRFLPISPKQTGMVAGDPKNAVSSPPVNLLPPMTFQRLQGVLGSLKNQYQPAEETQLQQVLRHWSDVVGVAVAAQTRPITVQREVLKVATANAGWAQNLVFERRRILDKLNILLTTPLSDIRFSTTLWHNPDNRQALDEAERSTLWQAHPSRIEEIPIPKATAENRADPEAAFHYWSTVIQSRTQQLPLCPQCQCPAPLGEIQRWSICALCATKQW